MLVLVNLAFPPLFIVLALVAGGFLYRTCGTHGTPVALQAVATSPTFAGVSLRLEIASTAAERELGLGKRSVIPDDFGMLFVFPNAGIYAFWMKDTLVPLDMFWLDNDFRVVYMKTDVSPDTYPEVFYPSIPARYVLETKAGYGTAHGVATGTPLLLPSGFRISK